MNYKTKTTEEKVNYVSNKIKNLHDSKVLELTKFVIDNPDCTASTLVNLFKSGWGSYSSQCQKYWLNRGWPKEIAIVKAKGISNSQNKKRLSPFSLEFYKDKINPETNQIYTDDEANFKRNSYRPIRKEFWIVKGFSEPEAIELALSAKESNNIKGSKASASRDISDIRNVSPRCKEYYINRGYDIEEAEMLVSKAQTTFSLQTCIEKHGPDLGYSIWKERQEKWIKSLNDKSEEELLEMHRKKRVNYNRSPESEYLNLYLVEILYPNNDKKYYKIGITKKSLNQRFASHIRYGGKVSIIAFNIMEYDDAVKLESGVLIKFNYAIQRDHTMDGYTECFDPTLITKEELLEFINNASNN